jgi:tetratricopeptide (TPR) repeat protein
VHSRFEDLQEILEKRAAHATGQGAHRPGRRRAKLLEDKLNNPEAAASALRDLGADAIADDEMLRRCCATCGAPGLAHEAARALSQRIEHRARPGGADSMQARRGAEPRAVAAQARRPARPAAAARRSRPRWRRRPRIPRRSRALAQLHLEAERLRRLRRHPRARGARRCAAARTRSTRCCDAGRVYREQVQAPDKARACFEEALEADPRNGEALRALASLLSAQANWDQARRVLETPAGDDRGAHRPGRRVHRPGAHGVGGFSDGAEAQRYLDEALTLVPNHLPAILAVADIHYKEGQWEQAEKRLTEAVRRLRGQPQQAAKLFQRLAEVHEKLGKLDEAYRQLVEADRMGPGQLLTKLSLG